MQGDPYSGNGVSTMANVFPSTLSFFRGFSNTSQVQVVTITGKDVWVTVSDPPPGGNFSWKGSPSGGWLLNPPTPASSSGSSGSFAGPGVYDPPISIPVTFVPSSPAPVHATMTVNIVRNDAVRSAIPGFPTDIALEGNADGVGPGALKIVGVDANPPGLDLAGEFVEIVNVTDATLDLQGCHVGDVRTHRGPRSCSSSRPRSPLPGARHRGATVPAYLHRARRSREFRLHSDRAQPRLSGLEQRRRHRLIRNPNGQLVDTFVYPVNGAAAPVTPAPEVNARVSVAPGAGLVATGIPVEEGDIPHPLELRSGLGRGGALRG